MHNNDIIKHQNVSQLGSNNIKKEIKNDFDNNMNSGLKEGSLSKKDLICKFTDTPIDDIEILSPQLFNMNKNQKNINFGDNTMNNSHLQTENNYHLETFLP